MSNWGTEGISRRWIPVLITLAVVVGLAAPFVGPAAANEDRVTVDAPSSATVGNQITIQGTVETEERRPSYEATFDVRLYVDGELQSSREVTISDGDRETVTFEYTFESSGEHSITIEAEAQGANPYRDSRTVSISVDPPETPNSTPEPPERSTATPTGPSESTYTGAAFAVPESLEDEVESYRDSLSIDPPANAFVLATDTELYIVFTAAEPQKGAATVEGLAASRTVEGENQTFGGIVASNVEFRTTGTSVDIPTVAQSPNNYALELIRVTGDYRRTATLTDPDQGENFTAAETGGVILEDGSTPAEYATRLGTAARTLVDNPNETTTRRIIGEPDEPHLWTASLETKYWVASETTIDAILLPPDSPARGFLTEFAEAETLPAGEQEPVLYLVDEQYDTMSFESVSDINGQPESLDGSVVSVNARVYQEQVSIQESIEHNTGCGEDLVPVKDACVNIPQDVTLHGGVAWNEIPQSRDGVLPFVAASSIEVDQPSQTVEGRYQLTGEVVSTSRINESLPEGAVLVVFEAERTGPIDYDAVSDEAKTLIEDRTQQAIERLRTQALQREFGGTGDGGEDGQQEARERVEQVRAGSPVTVEFRDQRRSGGVESVRLRTTEDVEDATVSAANVSRPPGRIGQPPGRAIQYINISTVNIPDGAIESATIRIRVSVSAEAAANLTVYRYHDGSWEPLQTSVAAEGEESVTLEATTDGFSYFAVSEAEQAAQSTPTEIGASPTATNGGETGATSEDGTGFTGLLALGVIFGLMLAAATRSNRSN